MMNTDKTSILLLQPLLIKDNSIIESLAIIDTYVASYDELMEHEVWKPHIILNVFKYYRKFSIEKFEEKYRSHIFRIEEEDISKMYWIELPEDDRNFYAYYLKGNYKDIFIKYPEYYISSEYIQDVFDNSKLDVDYEYLLEIFPDADKPVKRIAPTAKQEVYGWDKENKFLFEIPYFKNYVSELGD